MKIAGATVNQTPIDWSNNTGNIIAAIEEARQQGVRILCFPELAVTGYGCEDLFLTEWVPDRAWQELMRIKAHCKDITVAVGLPFRLEGHLYNGVAVISDSRILGVTLKQHLARDGVHYEPRWFREGPAGKTFNHSRGTETFPVGDVVYEVENVRFGFEICEDGWRKTERPGYRLAERGVQLILNPSASHFAMGKSSQREKEVVMAGSQQFRCLYLFVNLLGNEAGRMIYDGDIIAGKNGNLIAVSERLIFEPYRVMAFDADLTDEAAPAPLAEDELHPNEEVTRAISLGLYDYIRKSRARGFVVSLSGGADSGICAILVAEMVKRAGVALGWKRFCNTFMLDEQEVNGDWRKAVRQVLACAYQGTGNSSQETLAAARKLAESIGAGFHQWTIDEAVRAYSSTIEKVIGRQLSWATDDIALQNIQARARSPVIWMLANIRRAVLLTTSNRSEGDVGYATMDGDTSGSLSPIAGLSKVFILQWLKWAEKELGHEGLRGVNNLQPTAELRPPEQHQTDEADLMPYSVLARIERLAIFERRAPAEVLSVLEQEGDPEVMKGYVRKFFRMWAQNQWKRERFAPAFHLDDFNIDPRSWCRFPILSGGFAGELEQL